VKWPGKFSYRLPERATRFSIWGVLWIPVLGFAVWLLLREVHLTWPEVNLTSIPALTLLAVPLLVGYLVRRALDDPVRHSGSVSDRPLCAYVADRDGAGGNPHIRRKASRGSGSSGGGFRRPYQPLRAEIYNAVHSVVSPITPDKVDEPFQEALDFIPDGAHILLVGNQDAPDYPLFFSASSLPQLSDLLGQDALRRKKDAVCNAVGTDHPCAAPE